MKKIICSIFLGATLIFSYPVVSVADQTLQLVINNQSFFLPYPVLIEQGRTLLPLRFFSERFDAKVQYDEGTNTVFITKNQTIIKILLSEGRAFINDQEQSLNGPIRVLDGRLYVPLRFVGQALGLQISWDEPSKAVIVQTATKQQQDQQTQQDVNLTNPRVVWQKVLERPVSQRPLAVPDGTIYVPNGHILTALDKNGNILWSLPLGKFNFASASEQNVGSPILQNNTLFLSSTAYSEGSTSYYRTLFSVSKDGKLNWAMNHQSNYKGEYADITGIPAYSSRDNQLYFRDKEGMLAYLPDSNVRWRFSSDVELTVDPIIVNRN